MGRIVDAVQRARTYTHKHYFSLSLSHTHTHMQRIVDAEFYYRALLIEYVALLIEI